MNIKKKYVLMSLAFGTLTVILFAGKVKANLAFGSGYYTNLCGSGTAATIYNCKAACNASTGICTNSNGGVVRYVCSGKWNQCLESEEWGESKQIGQLSCGKTVQLSVYDRKCRTEEGTWDPECNLEGYMVWYSGDCWGNNEPAPTLAALPVTPTVKPSITPVPTVKLSPSVTPVSTVAVKNICGLACVAKSDCGAGFECNKGVCRNPACLSETSCFCGVAGVATSSGQTSPETGISGLWGVVLSIGMFGIGWKLKRVADKIW